MTMMAMLIRILKVVGLMMMLRDIARAFALRPMSLR
jgi:hypothetical protein